MLRYGDIQVICSGCNESISLIDFKWSCKGHGSGHKYASKQGLMLIMGFMGQTYGKDMKISMNKLI
jgi:hypothetical protein